jgi:uncharacterized damage-inducible protein DinB
MPNTPLTRYLETFEREIATTIRVLRAFPEDKRDMHVAERAKTPRQLAWLLAMEQRMLLTAITTGFDWSKPSDFRGEPPATLGEIIDVIEAGSRTFLDTLRSSSQLPATVSWFTGPKQMADVPLWDFLWFILHDQIHHRGQFSVYLRLAGAKVPSIYGPSADEPWS